MDHLHSVFNHLVLPPKIPGEQDSDLEGVSHEILRRLIQACETVNALADPPWHQSFQSLRVSLSVCLALNSPCLDKSTLLEYFGQLEQNPVLILHVVEQNAALLVRLDDRDGQQHVIFEAFETSAPSEKILAAECALQWDFPGRSAQIPMTKFADASFQESLAIFLEQANSESLHMLQATTRKAGVSVSETRDTTDPALITQMLIPVLEAMGGHFQAPTLRKRVRDDVNLSGGDLPWRRLPFWLVLRVAAQRQLCLTLGDELGRIAYKFLMSVLFSQLLQDCADKLSPESTVMLRAKLCRRMAKLEMDKTRIQRAGVEMIETIFHRIFPITKLAIEGATTQVETAWEAFKDASIRRVPRLPLRAPDHALRLSLSNSGEYLRSLLSCPLVDQNGPASAALPPQLEQAVKLSQDFTNHIFQLAATEERVEQEQDADSDTSLGFEDRCIQTAEQIDQVFTLVRTMYDSDPEHSSAMILTLFTLWIRLDKCAVAACPLLGDYEPAFNPGLLDALQLPTLSAMRRLQDIQRYLRRRWSQCRYSTVFNDVGQSCLAVRYVAQSAQMQALDARIQHASDQARDTKKAEWERACKKYDDHTAGMSRLACCCTYGNNGQRDVRGCTKCWHRRTRKRMRIQCHEALLPADNPARAVVVFDLALPAYLAAYRNATWQILNRLAHPTRPAVSSKAEVQLQGCACLKQYRKVISKGISLASPVKCFIQTHYCFKKGKPSLTDVLLPFAAKFELYDCVSKIWVKDLNKPLTFQHLCGIHVPYGLQGTILEPNPHPSANLEGPSSYEIQANQSRCPSDVSVYEFAAQQKLLAGKLRRWPNILVEIGSSNLDLGSEDSTLSLCQLAVQAGPHLPDEVLRATHVIFKEPAFLERLIEAIQKRLNSILTNWREHRCMELVVTLSLRLWNLSSGTFKARAQALLKAARDTTLGWITRLRREVRMASDEAAAAQRAVTYGFFAALLCRRTYAIYVELKQGMEPGSLATWVQASLTLQENLLGEMSKLPMMMKSMLVRDAKMAYLIRNALRNAIQADPASIGGAIAKTWSDSTENVHISFTTWNFLPSPHGRWITATMPQTQAGLGRTQRVHWNFIEGHLMVDGRPRGKMPLEIRNSSVVKHMFGGQHLQTYPSPLPGMTHRLVNFVHGQEIHFGLRGERVVIRARTRDGLLEFIPKDVFFSHSSGFDLPAELLDNCAHWLNLGTACLEIRRAPAIWFKRPRNWTVDVRGRLATRGNVNLVDPRSDTFSRVAGIFQHFERPEKLTVFQPQARGGNLSVELRHLELMFQADSAGLLQCQQLKATITPHQDIGTWHGLSSKLVLQDVVSHRRSVIVPLGKPAYKRRGIHVDVRLHNALEYAKYQVDEDLGRLSCPPEPRLLYFKALCYALTSFSLPDTLTQRTGTEEAFHILRSGSAQPWIPLAEGTHAMLNALSELSPCREYYPPQIKRLQKVTWDEGLTTAIQHDDYESLVRDIMHKSNRLNKFANPPTKEFVLSNQSHLRDRGTKYRQLYERPTSHTNRTAEDLVYVPRDRTVTSRASRVYETALLVASRCRSLKMTASLDAVLKAYKLIGGFYGDENPQPGHEPLSSQIEDPTNEKWGDLVTFCRYVQHQTPLMLRLGLLAFECKADMNVIRSLAAFAFIDELKSLPTPDRDSFVDYESRGSPSLRLLEQLIVPAHLSFAPRHRSRSSDVQRDLFGRNAEEHSALCKEESQRLASCLLQQWPVSAAELSTMDCEMTVVDAASALNKIEPEWERRLANSELKSYVDKVQNVLDSLPKPQNAPVLPEWESEDPVFVGAGHRLPIIPLAEDLVAKAGPRLKDPVGSIPFKVGNPATDHGTTVDIVRQEPSMEATELKGIFESLASSSNPLRQRYGGDLLESLAALYRASRMAWLDAPVPSLTLEMIAHAKEQAHSAAKNCLCDISSALATNDVRSVWLRLSATWPCMSPSAMLELLRSTASHEFGIGMKESLVHYALALTTLQRLERIRDSFLRGDKRMLDEEIRNPGHENWSPMEIPDWLLIEIDSNLLIRAEQVDVALAIIAPSSGANSVLQMSMGKGKTSCIMPMVVAVLANGKQLSRLLVPKALLMPTAQTTQSRLGGLVGREVRCIPFSRKTQATADMLELYANLHREMHDMRGLILTSHENVLSYKLGGWQHLADGKLEAAGNMIGFQNWLDSTCRDVLDECDVTLSVKTQLNYPSGSETPVDGHPFRWQVAQELLSRAYHHVPALQEKLPDSIDVVKRSGSLPMLHFSKRDAEDVLHDYILADICAGRTAFLRPADTDIPNREEVIRRALSHQPFDSHVFEQAARAFEDSQAVRKVLLTIRGLLTKRLLPLCLNKRWNVQYGLHPNRHPVAVPYDARGTPSEQSEFGHPDVSILFTCLSFYYTGLGFPQFHQSLRHVLHSSDPATQYDWWTSSCNTLPETLQHWNMVNVDDGEQIEQLWKHLRLKVVVIDHYLNHFVFPTHARQFRVKLQTSAWDLSLFSRERPGTRTTGFSGTNDNRMMLPLMIRQDDLGSLQHTSAEVLSYLLQRRNRGYQVTMDEDGRRLTEEGLLREMYAKKIRTLIDAGAYILEMDNRTLVTKWMAIDTKAKAAVYFRQDNRAWVYFRAETKNDLPLLATPMADDLDECLVYLDEAHTRGVDLKLPAKAHGALTLAVKQTKDYTIQAAMRFRQLSTTQSVTFFAPLEVDRSIRDFCRPAIDARIDSSHVISWLLEQTCRSNEDLQSLYTAQGLDFCRRTDATWRYGNFLTNSEHRTKLLNVLRQAERQTLEEMYGGATLCSSPVLTADFTSAPQLQTLAGQLGQPHGTPGAVETGALEEVEQQREMQVQVEQVRQVQRPPRYEALSFPGLDPIISRFVATGALEVASSNQEDSGFAQAFAYMAGTSLGKRYGVGQTDSKIWVSREFGKTIMCRNDGDAADNFLRPVEWILWSMPTETALVIIPEEAECLIPELRRDATKSKVHLIAYAAPVTKAMVCFNELRYYSLPELPKEYAFPERIRIDLGILAGRLYVDRSEGELVARYLRWPSRTREEGNDWKRDVGSESASTVAPTTFANGGFLLEWLSLNRKTQDVLHTPIGYIYANQKLGGRPPALAA